MLKIKKEDKMVDKKSVRELFNAIEEQFNIDLVQLDKYKEVVSRRRNKSNLIENSVSKQDFDLKQEYLEIENEASSIEMEEAFVKGFSTAYQLLIDSLM